MSKKRNEEINRCLIAVKNGEEGSVEKLHALMAPAIRYIALKYIHDEHSADDAVQDFWRDVPLISKGFIFSKNGFGFLCKVMSYLSINYSKKINREKSHIEPVDYRTIEQTCDQSIEDIQLRMVIEQAMEKLSSRERIVLQETYFEDKTLRQIASDMNISKSTAGNLKKIALDGMKAALDEMGLDKFEL